MTYTFTHRLTRELPGDTATANHSRQVHGALWSAVSPAPVSQPRLVAYSREVAEQLGIAPQELASSAWVSALSGNNVIDGMQTYATAYGGHQFGNWAGQLGDGRAIFLGELQTASDDYFELQLKGAGPTPFSRRADGRAVMRSSIREFLCSEAMHHLGIPTTRALSLVATGDRVERDMFYDGNAAMEAGAIVCRVAPSFLRFGHYELPASRGDATLLRALIAFTIRHYFPDIASAHADEGARIVAWYAAVCQRTAQLMANWMRVGFVHGVMNTDNMSILGLTIDYGPYGWIDHFDPNWTPNTTDAHGRRYAFGRQPGVAHWNLARLGDALATLDCVSIDDLSNALSSYEATYATAITQAYAAKLGLEHWTDTQGDMLDDLFALFGKAEIDMTIFFRALARATRAEDFANAFYSNDEFVMLQAELAAWFARYQSLVSLRALGEDAAQQRIREMLRANPKYVLRNYLAQEAIDAASEEDFSKIETLLEVLRHPHDEQPQYERFAAKRPEWARTKAGCSMLSCSS